MARLFQGHQPLNAMHTHLATIRSPSDDLNRQLEVHQYVSHVNEDVMQSALFDSDRSDAKLIGIEYIITEKVFNMLPTDEKKFWYSRGYEASSGILVAPYMPTAMENKLMSDLAPTYLLPFTKTHNNSYSKSLLFWDSSEDRLPVGLPKFGVPLLRDGTLRPETQQRVYKDHLGIDLAKEKQSRSSVSVPYTAGKTSDPEMFTLTVKR